MEEGRLVVADAEQAAYVGVGEVQLGDALQRVGQLGADVVHVAELVGRGHQRTQHDAHGLDHALVLVHHGVAARVFAQGVGQALERAVGEGVQRAAQPERQRGAG